MGKRILLCHDLDMPLSKIFEDILDDYTIETVSFAELLAELSSGNYDGLIIDWIAPMVFTGQGIIADIDSYESYRGELTAYILALRLKEVYPTLPIVILIDAGIPGGSEGVRLTEECRQKSILLCEIQTPKRVIDFIKSSS